MGVPTLVYTGVGKSILVPLTLPLPTDANNPFQYDWHHLRVAGLGVAAFLCVLGFIVLLSGKCKCRSKASHQRHPPEMSHLVGTGAVSTC
ncbi:PREDICTED: FXYD domain-containing ion transport regulator 3-like isoform X2 [Lepidothrix coronata]|uniref:FXYD domain-containing ion transport regulator n=1 Tax=Lepidothrix coronata TaxID=321398 RepID=A0A6J0J9D8_9PASS|nr:PREDICTED: FXYD domain-containing ion transport regulator 3-like isoform X2 [Lepidothrix coronata]